MLPGEHLCPHIAPAMRAMIARLSCRMSHVSIPSDKERSRARDYSSCLLQHLSPLGIILPPLRRSTHVAILRFRQQPPRPRRQELQQQPTTRDPVQGRGLSSCPTLIKATHSLKGRVAPNRCPLRRVTNCSQCSTKCERASVRASRVRPSLSASPPSPPFFLLKSALAFPFFLNNFTLTLTLYPSSVCFVGRTRSP